MRFAPEVRLTEEEIEEVLARHRVTGDVGLRDQIVVQFKHLVESIARRFAGSGEPIEDLIQEGYLGLLTAIRRYDAEKGVKFSTYATHFIIGEIKHALRDKKKIIKEPAWLQELNGKMTRIIEALTQELDRQPDCGEIGKEMHLPEETVAELLTVREVFKVASLDSEQDENAPSGSEMDKVSDEKCTTFQLPVEDKIVLEVAVNKLKLVEQKVIQEHYYTGLNQTEIAEKLGISCNYVSHILRNGTKKLRRILTTDEIKETQMQLQLASRRSDAALAETRSDIIDGVTGTYSRRYLEDRVEEEILRVARDKSEAAFAVVAIGGLDVIARRFGAMHRDDALCSLAQIVKANVRKCDIVGRLSDHEFGLILLHTKQQCDRICKRVREAIQQARFGVEGSQALVSFTAEVGYAVCPGQSTVGSELVSIARTYIEDSGEFELKKAA